MRSTFQHLHDNRVLVVHNQSDVLAPCRQGLQSFLKVAKNSTFSSIKLTFQVLCLVLLTGQVGTGKDDEISLAFSAEPKTTY
mmetsp:Transcript_14407/g.28121  ORF Transcript_14407/g.28121 Transcript_14407/m.28121 type:complete len:82 (+) Transcript_14407:3320-3565(+)